jgi:hypothetical protein
MNQRCVLVRSGAETEARGFVSARNLQVACIEDEETRAFGRGLPAGLKHATASCSLFRQRLSQQEAKEEK